MNAASDLELPAVIRYDNAATVRAAGERHLDQAPDGVRVSLRAITESNSVIVAVLLAWVRHAQSRGKDVRFVDVPADLRNIIELYGVAEVLPLEGGAPGDAWSPGEQDGPQAAGTR